MHHPSNHTVAMIRHLSAMPIRAPKRKQGRLPKQEQPDAIRIEYFNALKPVCVLARKAFENVQGEILRLLTDLRVEQGRMDADQGKRAVALVDKAAKKFTDQFKPAGLHAVVKEFGKKTSDFQKKQLNKQIEAAIGVSYSAIEKPIRDHVEGWTAVNVDLIQTVPERYFDRIRTDVEDAFASGTHPDTLAKDFQERFDMSENDAMRIARDQIGKLNGDVNQARQESLGVENFIWRTVNDGRVRESHADLDGETFAWSEPPEDEDTGEEITPGSPIQCRCYSEPDFSDILASL